jgi:hypothetical protein
MRMLELFSGTGTVARVARELGMETFTVDKEASMGADLTMDVLDLVPSMLPWRPDIIWASPPCTAFTVAAIGRNWEQGTDLPKTSGAILGMRIVLKTVEIIRAINPTAWYIENPVGKLRKLGIITNGIRRTITFCGYEEFRRKPTDIWTNDLHWQPKSVCSPGAPCHESAPRGSKRGTQGLKGAKARAAIPEQLAHEVLISAKKLAVLKEKHHDAL